MNNFTRNIFKKTSQDKNKNPVSGWILIHEIPSLDLSQISHSCCALMRDLAEIQFRNLIIKIHPLTGFCLILCASLHTRMVLTVVELN